MQAITFDYATSPISNVITQYDKDVTQRELEEFSQNSELLPLFSYDWMTTTLIVIIALSVCILALSPIVYAVSRAAKNSRAQSRNNAENTAGISIIIFELAAIVFGVFFVASLIIDFDTTTRVDHPNYDAALSETVAANREDIDEAVRLAAASQYVDLDSACRHGKASRPKAVDGEHYTDETAQLVQCGGDTFGALLYANTESTQFQSISTATGATTFKVIVATGDTAKDSAAAYSSVQFPGVKESRKYNPTRRYTQFAWNVDSPSTNDAAPLTKPPYDDEHEMTLDEARSRYS